MMHHLLLDPCTDFQWGEINGRQFCDFILSTYEEAVHWRSNNFLVPYVKAGKSFVCGLARLYRGFSSSFHCIDGLFCYAAFALAKTM